MIKMSKINFIFSFIKSRYFNKFATREALLRYQRKKLDKYFKDHILKVDFYREYKDFESLPIIDKKLVMDNFHRFNKYRIKKEDCLPIVKEAEKTRDFTPRIDGLTIGLSSGTSGNSGIFLLSPKEEEIWKGYMIGKLLPSLTSNEKIAFFLRANSNLYEGLKSRKIKFKFFDLFEDYKDNINTLGEFKPSILVAPAQMLKLISKSQNNKEIDISPKLILSVAEVLSKEDKSYIEGVFGVEVKEIYQCTEGFLAHTCSHGSIHLNEDMVYFEKEYIDEKRFVPIITDFIRESQMMVRYRLNDILVENTNPCPCGSHFIRIDAIEGREDDIFRFGDTIIFPDFIRRKVIGTNEYIEDYLVVKNKDTIKVHVKPQKYFDDVVINLKKLFDEKDIKGIDFEMIDENKIDLTRKKRRVYVESR